MKTSLSLALFLLIHSAAEAQSLVPCRFDLVGPKTYSDSVLERQFMTPEACEKRAAEVLRANAPTYELALIFDEEGKIRKRITLSGGRP